MGTVHAKSLDPLPMHGRDLGIHPDDLMEPPEPEQESKQEVLENKDVSSGSVVFYLMENVLNCSFNLVQFHLH
ncbi:Sorting and assembly machinery component 50 A [Goodea atripinnis]|uniref:Sorting and assembly machinery component 50 A n=1 Tax=Goodea atripinnis TaxID=208336 RepID=A0ABV0NTB0_9TELE